VSLLDVGRLIRDILS